MYEKNKSKSLLLCLLTCPVLVTSPGVSIIHHVGPGLGRTGDPGSFDVGVEYLYFHDSPRKK